MPIPRWDASLIDVMLNYFSYLFNANEHETDNIREDIQTSISPGHNANLLGDIKGTEVRGALFQMYPDKSPEPDGG